MRDIYWLSQIQFKERSLVGNELFIQSQLLRSGYPILPGFVLGNNLWREFLGQTDNWRSLAEWEDNARSIGDLAQYSQQKILQRSIAEAWQTVIEQAAQQLNCPNLRLQPFLIAPQLKQKGFNSLWRSHVCQNSTHALNRAVKLAWSDLFSATSLAYFHRLQLNWSTIDLAVLIRPLNNVEASGIVTFDNRSIQIQATWGLEQSLVRGDVEPDLYYLEDGDEILERHLGRKNYGYRVKSSDTHFASGGLLEPYLPPEHLAALYVLDAAAIAKLVQLVRRISQQQPQTKYLVWNAESLISNNLNFQIIQVSDRHIFPSVLNSKFITPKSAATPLLSGIAASPGAIQAELTIIPDLNDLSSDNTWRDDPCDQGNRSTARFPSQTGKRNYY